MRSNALRLAVRPTMRAMPLATIVAGAGAGVVALALATAFASEISPLCLAFAIALTASAAGFAFDDSAEHTLEPSPTTLGQRRMLRLAIAAGVLACAWALDVLMMRPDGINVWLLVNDRTLALVALAATAVAIATIANRHELDHQGGAVGATAAVFTLAGTEILSARWPSQLPSVLRDFAPNDRWWWLLAAATAVIVWLSRDPATPHGRSANSPRE